MLRSLINWFRRNAYGTFTLRALVAVGSAIVSVALSFLPYDTALQAIWVIVSTLFMASLVLRQRLNETDDVRYRRLFHNRFTFLQHNDPEALTTVFAENIRPRVLDWFHSEYGIAVGEAKMIDALDSLARNGDSPGQLIFRTGVELGQWLESSRDDESKVANLENRLQKFIVDNNELMGGQVAHGIFLRHIRPGEQRPVGVHMFHPVSRLLLTVEYYDPEQQRHSLALSAKADLFRSLDDSVWLAFRDQVHREFPCFRPANGGSGPQKKAVPYFVGSIVDDPPQSDEQLSRKLLSAAEALPSPPQADDDASETDTAAAQSDP